MQVSTARAARVVLKFKVSRAVNKSTVPLILLMEAAPKLKSVVIRGHICAGS